MKAIREVYNSIADITMIIQEHLSILRKKKPLLRDNYIIIPYKLVYMEHNVSTPKWLIELKLYTLGSVNNPTIGKYYPLLF